MLVLTFVGKELMKDFQLGLQIMSGISLGASISLWVAAILGPYIYIVVNEPSLQNNQIQFSWDVFLTIYALFINSGT